eukprot:CAMPEP_0175819470 /NCGR_PEP_ID=MMETSP0107_2-20121207/8087_1 /TAXON_ID=195067 ORGANISM="Goniomonas pacifica, Strain CCMP1869" /NCGR_SAMPLE_ID=MMETSP0107_2 /ASSEMBLY_ACC=CAM_ASM_000203 /LENGTH=69 /DNA_ID=CAMNT_0017131721 /DNA_START=128 /DNA_END=337 /DNA_ORIENTATION=-
MPQSSITTLALGVPEFVPTPSMNLSTSMPCTTFPNTTCFPSNQEVTAVVRKNWLPLEFGPELAMLSKPG